MTGASPPLDLRVPGSKSETQRGLVIAALAPGWSTISGPLDCDDSRALRGGLRDCGAEIIEEVGRWRVRGGVLRVPAHPIDCGEAGTALRFLLPLSLHLDGELQLDGGPRLRERPIEELLLAVRALGVEARALEESGRLPLGLRRGRPAGQRVTLDASASSQFASGLLLCAPRLPAGLTLELEGPVVSRPYLSLTLRMMRAAGAVILEDDRVLRVEPGGYRPGELSIGGDWSSAAFLLAAGFIRGRSVRIVNLEAGSAQGDRVIVEHLDELRLARPHELDLTDCPDLIAPLAAAAVFATHPTSLVGLAHARLKESDRPAVLAGGLTAAGVRVTQGPDRLLVEPAARLRPARLDPRGDHRMAMAFGLLALSEPGIEVCDPGCVSKSYPGFWQELERFR